MNCPAVIKDKLAGVKEPQSKTADLASVVRVDLIKFFKDLGNFFLADSGAVVGNRQGELPVL